MLLSDQQREEFKQLSSALIQWLNVNTHPHTTVIITPTSAELLEGAAANVTFDYVPH